MPQLALSFAISAILVVAAGTFLARSGDVVAARTKLGGVWVGSVFLAAATSLPELTTDIAAVRIGEPDLAAGDLFGSSMANMLILALLTLLPTGRELFRSVTFDHVLYASLAIVLTAIAAVLVVFRPSASYLGIGVGAVILLAAYAMGSRAVFRHTALARRVVETEEMSAAPETAPGKPAPRHEERAGLRRAIVQFLLAALVILVAAPAFARSAAGIAEATGVGMTFTGTWLVGLATSLPELATSLAAVRMRAYDLAVGNLFGSNAFNMAAFVVLDVVHRDGTIFQALSSTHVLSALMAIVLMGIGIGAIIYRAQARVRLLEPAALLIICGYMVGIALVFSGG